METSKTYFIIAFDYCSNVRYIDDVDSRTGSCDEYSAKQFDTRQEAQNFIDTKGYIAWVQEFVEHITE